MEDDKEKWENRIEVLRLVVPLLFAGLGVVLIAIALLQSSLSSDRNNERIIDKIFDTSNNLILLGGGALTAGGLGLSGRKRGNVTTVSQEFQQPVDNVIAPTPGSIISTSDYSSPQQQKDSVIEYDDEP